MAGSSPLDKLYNEGTYNCAGCDTPLYTSNTKYRSNCGWPSADLLLNASPTRLRMQSELKSPWSWSGGDVMSRATTFALADDGVARSERKASRTARMNEVKKTLRETEKPYLKQCVTMSLSALRVNYSRRACFGSSGLMDRVTGKQW